MAIEKTLSIIKPDAVGKMLLEKLFKDLKIINCKLLRPRWFICQKKS